MIRLVPDEVWAFDCEWVPDVRAGRLLYGLPDDVPDAEVLRVMWEQGGATEENPMPFLKTVLCRVVSVATVIRRQGRSGEVALYLQALPEEPGNAAQDERHILRRFLEDGVARRMPQLVGFNSRNADLRILTQRAIVNGLSLKSFCARLDAKPWESPDVDLMEMVSGYGRGHSVALNELATLSGVPGKLDTRGEDVCGMWYRGEHEQIVQYNCFDALTTYLVWLRMAFFSGAFTEEEYVVEQRRVKVLLLERMQKPEQAYLRTFYDAWRELKEKTGQAGDGVFTGEEPAVAGGATP